MTQSGDGLRDAARRAVERAEEARRAAAGSGEAPRPGDLYVLPATADFDVEWLVVAADGADRWVVLPADLSQFPGGGDVEVPAEEPGGPLTVYTRFPVTVPGRLLRAELRGGRVGEERRAAAERRWREIAAGAQPPVRESDFDPDHRRRLVELAAAQRALEAAVGEAGGEEGGADGSGEGGGEEDGADPNARGRVAPLAVTPPVPARLDRPSRARLRPPPWMSALAAVLALAVIGLVGWNVSLQRQVERLSGAQVLTPGPEVRVGTIERGVVSVPAGEQVAITFTWPDGVDPEDRFRLTILSARGDELTDVELAPGDRGEEAVEVPGAALRRARALRLERLVEGGPDEVVLERRIEVERP